MNGTGCGDNERLIDNVVNGLKPMGVAICWESEVEMITDKAKAKSLPYVVLEHPWERRKKVGVANVGKIKDLFDMEALVASYKLFDKALGQLEFGYWTKNGY